MGQELAQATDTHSGCPWEGYVHIKEKKDFQRFWRIRSRHNHWIIELKATAPSMQFRNQLLAAASTFHHDHS